MVSESNPLEWKMNSNAGSVLIRCIYEPSEEHWLALTESFSIILRTLNRIAAYNQNPIKPKWSDFYPEATDDP